MIAFTYSIKERNKKWFVTDNEDDSYKDHDERVSEEALSSISSGSVKSRCVLSCVAEIEEGKEAGQEAEMKQEQKQEKKQEKKQERKQERSRKEAERKKKGSRKEAERKQKKAVKKAEKNRKEAGRKQKRIRKETAKKQEGSRKEAGKKRQRAPPPRRGRIQKISRPKGLGNWSLNGLKMTLDTPWRAQKNNMVHVFGGNVAGWRPATFSPITKNLAYARLGV